MQRFKSPVSGTWFQLLVPGSEPGEVQGRPGVWGREGDGPTTVPCGVRLGQVAFCGQVQRWVILVVLAQESSSEHGWPEGSVGVEIRKAAGLVNWMSAEPLLRHDVRCARSGSPEWSWLQTEICRADAEGSFASKAQTGQAALATLTYFPRVAQTAFLEQLYTRAKFEVSLLLY